jgi:hypothetical protein
VAHETEMIDNGFSDSLVRADLIMVTKEEMNAL